MGATCSTCRFFHRSNVISNPDACRRFPHFERRNSGEWCGEHESTQAPAFPGPDDPVDWGTYDASFLGRPYAEWPLDRGDGGSCPIPPPENCYTGPIEPGMVFDWRPNVPLVRSRVEVVRTGLHFGGKPCVLSRVLEGGRDAKGSEWWNEEGGFRAACRLVSSPSPESDDEKKEDGENSCDEAENRDFLPPSARVRDELAVMVEGFDDENRPAWFIIECILNRLAELPGEECSGESGYVKGEWSRSNVESFVQDIRRGLI